jgi:hypothetical protein
MATHIKDGTRTYIPKEARILQRAYLGKQFGAHNDSPYSLASTKDKYPNELKSFRIP